MKIHTQKNGTGSHNPSKIAEFPCQHNGQCLDDLAADLDGLARKSLRDGVLKGTLTGQESEIRNDAVILALRWFLKQDDLSQVSGDRKPKPTWHAARSIAHALKFAKMRHLEFIRNGTVDTVPIDEMNGGSTPHPSDLTPLEWPVDIAREILCRGIHLAAKRGRISHANACIAHLIYLDNMPISLVASRRGVHRSAIYQHLWRVKQVLPEVLESIEAPPMA